MRKTSWGRFVYDTKMVDLQEIERAGFVSSLFIEQTWLEVLQKQTNQLSYALIYFDSWHVNKHDQLRSSTRTFRLREEPLTLPSCLSLSERQKKSDFEPVPKNISSFLVDSCEWYNSFCNNVCTCMVSHTNKARCCCCCCCFGTCKYRTLPIFCHV